MKSTDIIKASANSLNIYSFTAEALERLIEAVKAEQSCKTCEALARAVMLDQTSHDTHSQARNPLPCETIRELWCDAATKNNGSGWFVISQVFARAIEAAHGIKGEA